jgi:hypothetical protein
MRLQVGAHQLCMLPVRPSVHLLPDCQSPYKVSRLPAKASSSPFMQVSSNQACSVLLLGVAQDKCKTPT